MHVVQNGIYSKTSFLWFGADVEFMWLLSFMSLLLLLLTFALRAWIVVKVFEVPKMLQTPYFWKKAMELRKVVIIMSLLAPVFYRQRDLVVLPCLHARFC